MMHVFVLPPSESRNKRVNLLSLNSNICMLATRKGDMQIYSYVCIVYTCPLNNHMEKETLSGYSTEEGVGNL